MTELLQYTISVKKSHEQCEIFVHELQSALRLTVGFSNIRYEP